jgi:cell wall-associated NlpC family hydrolase
LFCLNNCFSQQEYIGTVFDFLGVMKYCFTAACLLGIISCSHLNKQNGNADSVINNVIADSLPDTTNAVFIETKNITPQQITDYAKTLIGIPYKYASTDPSKGFDCSGFITYVFNHFNIDVPRSSVDFTHVYHEVPLANAKPSDLVLFTGTDSTEKTVGHMGIIVSNINDSIAFIHSTSGKANGVTITPLNTYYMSRFVKVVRVFPQNDSLHLR